jgi:hypothetical protein
VDGTGSGSCAVAVLNLEVLLPQFQCSQWDNVTVLHVVNTYIESR